MVADYKQDVPALLDYLDTFVPSWALPLVNLIGEGVRPYFKEYGEEMVGLSQQMGVKEGYIVALNMVYQLEGIGINCSNWNTTGPTVPNDPGCEAAEPAGANWCYCKQHASEMDALGFLFPGLEDRVNAPGLCTSIVAQDPHGQIFHGRNLDWNLPDALLNLAIDVEYQRSNVTVFHGTTILGFVGVFNGMVPGQYAVSIDARGKGGTLSGNVLEGLLHSAMTPSQHLRMVLEQQPSFEQAVDALGSGDLIDEIYYIASGANAGEGVVMSRDRNKIKDKWWLNATEEDGWFRLQTNYDHWNPVPAADDRRTPGIEHMKAVGQAGVGIEQMLTVMETWPTFNHHTDYTGVYSPFNSTYISMVWPTNSSAMMH